MSGENEITLLTIFNEIGKLRQDVFQSIQHDQEQCRARHDEINTKLAATHIQNGAQDKKSDDHEKRMREVEKTMWKAAGATIAATTIISIAVKIF